MRSRCFSVWKKRAQICRRLRPPLCPFDTETFQSQPMSYRSEVPLEDRVAIVTGGSGGIGFETSKALLENGATVVISDSNANRGEQIAQELGIEFFPADLTHSS